MHIRLPHARRPVVAVFGGALFGAALVGAGPVVPGMWDRPACAETVMKAVSTEQPVAGTYNCFDRSLQTGLVSVGIDSDGALRPESARMANTATCTRRRTVATSTNMTGRCCRTTKSGPRSPRWAGRRLRLT